MANLEETINQAIADFDDIEKAIEESGIDVPYDTDTSEYGNLVRKVYEAGQEIANQEWDNIITNFGARKDYEKVFYAVGLITFPKLNMANATSVKDMCGKSLKLVDASKFPLTPNCTTANGLFLGCPKLVIGATHMQFKTGAYFTQMYQQCTALEEVGVIECEKPYNTNYMFYLCYNLKTVGGVPVGVGGDNNNMFGQCPNLENLTINGTIKVNGFAVNNSNKLTHDSLMSIINALEDKSADTSGTTWKVTIGGTNKAKLTEEEIKIAEDKNWTVI